MGDGPQRVGRNAKHPWTRRRLATGPLLDLHGDTMLVPGAPQ
jgi:hypothetical protein